MLESEVYNLHFLKKAQSNRMFAGYNMIKSDIAGFQVKVNEKYIKYYQTNFKQDKLYADFIYQIDINSCYPSILLNAGMICEDTFKYLASLSKENRLAAIGMLASRKNIFHFDGKGEIQNHEVAKSKYSDYFFYCVQETYKIMDECRMILGNDFLFIWVDAIYFSGNPEKADKIVDFLRNSYKLKSSINKLTEFEIEFRGSHYRVRYIDKDGDSTFMNIPSVEQEEKAELLKYLLNIKNLK